jgi:myo-inositol-1(or 4)-monophosphatase
MNSEIDEIKQIVTSAGKQALPYHGKVSKSFKSDMSIFTEADAAIENFLHEALTELKPNYGYISEEDDENQPPLDGERHSWVVDALDGTLAFQAKIPLWTPAVCVLDGTVPVAGAAYNPVTDELFWADRTGPGFCNNDPLKPEYSAELERTTFLFGPTNYHKLFRVEGFPGRIYCLGAPIYQLCLTARGAVSAMFFNPAVRIWDLAFPALLLERAGAQLIYASGNPVTLPDLMDRSVVPEPFFAGGAEMIERLRNEIVIYTGS